MEPNGKNESEKNVQNMNQQLAKLIRKDKMNKPKRTTKVVKNKHCKSRESDMK
jgi:hypothetical protein